MILYAGADFGRGHQAWAPLFLLVQFLESYICPYNNTCSSYIDLICLFCVYVTVKVQFDNSNTCEYSSYSPSAWSICSIARLGLPYSEIMDPPLICLLMAFCKPLADELKYAHIKCTPNGDKSNNDSNMHP